MNKIPETTNGKLNVKINFRLSSSDFDLMNSNIELLNNSSDFSINQQSYIRLAIRLLNRKIKVEGLRIQFEP